MANRFSGCHRYVFALLCLLLILSTFPARESLARNLTDTFAQGFIFTPSSVFLSSSFGTGEPVDFSAAGAAVAPAFAAAVAQAVTQEFPLTSVSPAFTYRYNPAVDTFERLTSVPGPLFSERAVTLGKGQLNFSIGYSFTDFSDLNGTPLKNLRGAKLIAEEFPQDLQDPVGQLPTGEILLPIPFSLSRIHTRVDLQAHIVVPTLRYGVTDRWDMSLSLPVVNTFLRVRNEVHRVADIAAFLAVGPGTIRHVDAAGNTVDPANPPFVKTRRPAEFLRRAAGHATGVGDITLRTKYYLWQQGFGGAAVGLNLQLPSGDSENFHGTDETHLTTFLYLSQILWEQIEPHLNVGLDFNADDVDRSSVLYAIGASLSVHSQLGVVADFIGRSEFGKLPVHLPASATVAGTELDRKPATCTTTQPCFTKGTVKFPVIPIRIKRNDIVDFSFGLRYAIGSSGSIFFGGIVPLNSDGFRPDFIPAGGIEYTF
jgi:hypothetical protein